MISAILFLSFFVFLILGIPIGICLGLSSICAILYSGTSLTIVATNMYSGISKFLLLAIPFFVLSGNIMAKAGISKRLIRFVDTCVGHKKGGIAIVCVIVACFFGAISGSGPATVAALGMVLIPAMIERGGFSAPFSHLLLPLPCADDIQPDLPEISVLLYLSGNSFLHNQFLLLKSSLRFLHHSSFLLRLFRYQRPFSHINWQYHSYMRSSEPGNRYRHTSSSPLTDGSSLRSAAERARKFFSVFPLLEHFLYQ